MIQESMHTALNQLTEEVKTFKAQQAQKIAEIDKRVKASWSVSKERPAVSQDEKSVNRSSFETFLRQGDRTPETKALSRGEEPGSYLIPQPVQERIQRHLSPQISLRSVARIMQISSAAADILVDSQRPSVGWVDEKDERPETDVPALKKVHIQLQELYAKPRATQTLLDDTAINIEDWLVQKVSEQMLSFENQAFISGDGQKKPKGFLSYETVDAENWVWGKLEHIKTGVKGAFQENKEAETLIDLMSQMKTEYLSGCVWIMSRSAHATIRKVVDGTTGQHLWQPAFAENAPSTLLGYPVLIMDEMPALVSGTASKSVVFGNFQAAYQIVEKQSLSVLRDPYSAKPYIEFYVTKRVGGDVIDFEGVKVLSFSE